MISPLNAVNTQFLASLNSIQSNLTSAQRQLSSGLKIVNAADSPDQISQLLAARASLATTQQTVQNLGLTKTEVDTSETVLSQASATIQSALVSGSAGASSTATAATRSTLADQIGSALEQLVSIANTAVGGRYVFSGDNDQVPPYSVDLTQPNPVSAYQGTAATRQALSPDGTTFPTALTAQQLFDAPAVSNNVFSSLVALRSALQNNDTTGITSAMTTLQTSSTYFEQQNAFYGNAQNQVQSATDYGTNLQLSLQTQISGIADADSAQALLELTQSQTALQAALQSKAQIPTTTLFDFMK
jgi:flagellar hook-associated protein 3 FlgL